MPMRENVSNVSIWLPIKPSKGIGRFLERMICSIFIMQNGIMISERLPDYY